jgi:hypothetical protein
MMLKLRYPGGHPPEVWVPISKVRFEDEPVQEEVKTEEPAPAESEAEEPVQEEAAIEPEAVVKETPKRRTKAKK